MEIDRVLEWVQTTWIATLIAENDLLFPWIESIHVLAIVLVIGTISIVDLRLLGVASLDVPVRRVMRDVIPYTWCAFVIAAVTGSLMFSSDATHYGHNRLFQAKLVMLLLAGVNMAAFHLLGVRNIGRWDAPGQTTPMGAKAAAAISLVVWITVVSLGRGTGFTMH